MNTVKAIAWVFVDILCQLYLDVETIFKRKKSPINSKYDETETMYDDRAPGLLSQLRNAKQINRPVLPKEN